MVVVAVCLGGSAAVWGATIHVPQNYTSIQTAIDAAANGDEVVIAPGRYVERINFNGKAITVRGCDPNDPAIVASTIIVGYELLEPDGVRAKHGCSPVVTFASREGEDSKLLGLTITGGIAFTGAGILCDGASPTIQRNVITNNGVEYYLFSAASKQPENVGGGIALLHGASPLIDSNEISLNFAELGGGIYATGSTTRPTITNNVITANTAYVGGGVYADLGAILTVKNNKFGTAPNGNLTAQAASLKAKAVAARQKKPAVGSAKGKAAKAADVDYVRKARKASPESIAKLKNARKFTYSGNVACIGGAMALSSCEMELSDNVFTNNSAIDFGGAIAGWELCLESDCNVFDRNFTDDIDEYILQIDDNGFGGAIDLVYGQADFNNDRFTYNTSGGGGAIALDSGTIVVKDCLFDHNMANEEGGAIAAAGFDDDDFTASVEDCTFTNNSSYDGGAIAAYGPDSRPFSPFNVTDSTFECNTAICGSGGAVYVEDGVEMKLAKCSFENNAADYYGSAVANIGALLTLEDSTLRGNLGADYCYGTVYVEDEDDEIVSPPTIAGAKRFHGDESLIQRNTFVRNINYEGAGIYVDSGEVFITNNSFTENIVNGEGGAIYWANDNDGGCVSWNTFVGNSASRGGAIYIDPESCYLEVQYNKFSGNIAGTANGLGGAIFIGSNCGIKNNTFCNNNAGYRGGAIYLGPGLITIGTSQIDGISARIKNNSFSDNFALQGGTIFTYISANGGSVPAAAKSNGGTEIKNNIIAFSKRGCGVWFEGDEPYFAYNNVYGNVPQNYCNVDDLTDIDGNISVDPLFVDRATCNLYLKSVAGHWDEATGTWVRDQLTSQSIDAGDPASDYDLEPEENGDIINQGAQGNTQYASKSSMFASVAFAAGQAGVSRSGPYKFVFFDDVVRDDVTAKMSVYRDNALCSTAKQITSGVVWSCRNKLAYCPFAPLQADTAYQLVFGAYIKLANGDTIPWSESFPFVTGVEPVVTAIDPGLNCSVPTDSVIGVNFDQSMRTCSVETCFAIKPNVPGTFEWNDESSAFDFIPSRPLAAGVTYTITVGASSRDTAGDRMLRSFCWQFHTGSYEPAAAVAVSATAASTSAGAQITVNLASAATVSASIRNLAGVEIATVAPQALDSGVSTLLWNGKSKSGTNVPAGRYLVTVTAAKADGTQANALTTLQR